MIRNFYEERKLENGKEKLFLREVDVTTLLLGKLSLLFVFCEKMLFRNSVLDIKTSLIR